MPYEPPPIETDLDAVTSNLFDGIAEQIPGWIPIEGTLDTAIVEEVGRETLTTNNQALTVIDLAVAGFGESVYGLAIRQATPAELETTFTVTQAGDIIPAGVIVVGTNDVGLEIAFQTLNAVTTSGTTEDITVYAVEDGAAGNGVPAGPLTVATATATVVSVVALSESENGTDDELIADYLDRFIDYLSIFRVGVVRASDAEALARSVAGAYRARAIDLYDALTEATDAERTATVFLVAANGTPVNAAIKTEVRSLIEAAREVNFVLHVEDPTYVPLEIEYEGTSEDTANPATVEAAVIEVITNYLDPATWGSTSDDPRAWTSDTVRFLDLAARVNDVPGLAFLTSLTINGAAADYELGPGGLPADLPTTTIDGSIA